METESALAVRRPDNPAHGKWEEGGFKHPADHPAYRGIRIVDAARGMVEDAGGRTKIAIVGFASSTRDKAPSEDPEFPIVGLNQLYRYMPRYDLWFEIHQRPVFIADTVRDSNYLGWLQHAPIPIFMVETHPDIPQSVAYPLRAISQTFGREYFSSSIAYMFAWALAAGYKEIHIYGVDLIVGVEYFYQKACLEWWCGVAHGMGVRVVLPSESAILKQPWLYGYEGEPPFWPLTLGHLNVRIGKLLRRREEVMTLLNNLDGAIEEAKYYQHNLENVQKGAMMPPEL